MSTFRHLEPAKRLIVALDFPTYEAASRMFHQLLPVVDIFKIGHSLLSNPGAVWSLILDIKRNNRKVFLDAKLNDIPETVRAGVNSAARSAHIDFITVHADAAMLEAAMEGKDGRNIHVMAVTALTSIPAVASRTQFRGGVMNAMVADCDGMIMSPSDLNDPIWNHTALDDMVVATPGIRMTGSRVDSHQRTGFPEQAIYDGADLLIVGRPIIKAETPVAWAEEMIAEIAKGAKRLAGNEARTEPQDHKPIDETPNLPQVAASENIPTTE